MALFLDPGEDGREKGAEYTHHCHQLLLMIPHRDQLTFYLKTPSYFYHP